MSIRSIQTALDRIRTLRKKAEAQKNARIIKETHQMELKLQKQLNIAKIEEENLKMRKKLIAANERIRKARAEQRRISSGGINKIVRDAKRWNKELNKVSKGFGKLGRRLGL